MRSVMLQITEYDDDDDDDDCYCATVCSRIEQFSPKCSMILDATTFEYH